MLTPSMVAIFGWIIPEPFAIPPTLTFVPPTCKFHRRNKVADDQHSSTINFSTLTISTLNVNGNQAASLSPKIFDSRLLKAN